MGKCQNLHHQDGCGVGGAVSTGLFGQKGDLVTLDMAQGTGMVGTESSKRNKLVRKCCLGGGLTRRVAGGESVPWNVG